jgi:hypothetical protein
MEQQAVHGSKKGGWARGCSGTIAGPRFDPRVRWSNTGQRKEDGPVVVTKQLLVHIRHRIVLGCNGGTAGLGCNQCKPGPRV